VTGTAGVASAQCRLPSPHWRGLYDRRVGLGERQQFVDNALEVVDTRDKDFCDEAIFARHAVAFDDFRDVGQQLTHALQFAHRRSNADVGANAEPKRGRVEAHRESGDDAQVFQALHPIGSALRRQADQPGEIGD
jgi:hypothetical protein